MNEWRTTRTLSKVTSMSLELLEVDEPVSSLRNKLMSLILSKVDLRYLPSG